MRNCASTVGANADEGRRTRGLLHFPAWRRNTHAREIGENRMSSSLGRLSGSRSLLPFGPRRFRSKAIVPVAGPALVSGMMSFDRKIERSACRDPGSRPRSGTGTEPGSGGTPVVDPGGTPSAGLARGPPAHGGPACGLEGT